MVGVVTVVAVGVAAASYDVHQCRFTAATDDSNNSNDSNNSTDNSNNNHSNDNSNNNSNNNSSNKNTNMNRIRPTTAITATTAAIQC